MGKNVSKLRAINVDIITNKNNKTHKPKWSQTLDHFYRLLIVCSSGSGKTNC